MNINFRVVSNGCMYTPQRLVLDSWIYLAKPKATFLEAREFIPVEGRVMLHTIGESNESTTYI